MKVPPVGSLVEETLRLKKMAILCCGVILYFFTNMSKVLVPGTIFNDLLRSGLDVKSISALGAVYMYAYAASQLLAGIFADRYGGVRILLIGGSMFTAGTIGFPFAGELWLMYLCALCLRYIQRAIDSAPCCIQPFYG